MQEEQCYQGIFCLEMVLASALSKWIFNGDTGNRPKSTMHVDTENEPTNMIPNDWSLRMDAGGAVPSGNILFKNGFGVGTLEMDLQWKHWKLAEIDDACHPSNMNALFFLVFCVAG